MDYLGTQWIEESIVYSKTPLLVMDYGVSFGQWYLLAWWPST